MNHHLSHRTVAVHPPASMTIVWLNVALAAVAVAALVSYVVSANALAAQAWRMSDAQEALTGLLDVRNDLVAQQSALEDRAVLTALAADAGFVSAGAVVYLVEDQPVAAAR